METVSMSNEEMTARFKALFRRLKEENERLRQENALLRKQLGEVTEEQTAMDLADMEVIAMANRPKPKAARRGFFGILRG